jgi:hypothetical protein
MGNGTALWLKRILAAACCVLMPMLFFESPGTPDVGIFLDWQAVVSEQGLREAYRALIDEYPPLTHVALAIASAASRVLDLSPFHGLKLLLLLAGYASTVVMEMWRPRLVLPITALWAVYGMLYGYLDVLFAAPLLIALWCLERDRAGWAGVAYALACSIKWQPIIIAPFILAHFCIRQDWSRLRAFMLGGIALGAPVLAVFGLPVLVSFARAVRDPFISGNALNLPWLITAALEHLGIWGFSLAGSGAVANRSVSLADAPMPMVATVATLKAAFVLAYGYALARFVTAKATALRDLMLYGLAGCLAFFIFNTGVHENHLFVPALLAVLLLDYPGRPKWVMEGLLMLSVFNLVLFFGLTGERPFSGGVVLVLGTLGAVLLGLVYATLLASMRNSAPLWEGPAIAGSGGSSQDG